MNKIDAMRRVCPTLLLLICGLAICGCAGSGQVAKPVVCPTLPPPPANVMRSPQAEMRLRGLLFESGETPTTSSPPARPL